MYKLLLATLAASVTLANAQAVNDRGVDVSSSNVGLLMQEQQQVLNDDRQLEDSDEDILEDIDGDQIASAKKRTRRRAVRRPTKRPTKRPTAARPVTTKAPTKAPTVASTTKQPTKAPTTEATSGTQDDAVRFNIQLDFATAVTDAQRQGFERARAKWMSVITADFAATACVSAGQTFCGYTFKENTCIDDLFIGVKIAPIDGVGNIAGSAGPCAMDNAGKVRIGVMTFDSADANSLIQMGAWDSTIMHEMGHVLGIGTLWDYKRLITPSGQSAPFYYLGANGNAGLHSVPGGGSGNIVIEDQGGQGTARGHWKEAVYDSELMTGYLEGGGRAMPMSLLTVRALQDLGYVVDTSNADSYSVPSASGRRLRNKGEEKIPVGNDILNHEIIVLEDSNIKIKKGREAEFEEEKKRFHTHRQGRGGDNNKKD